MQRAWAEAELSDALVPNAANSSATRNVRGMWHMGVLGMIAGWDWLWIIALFVPYLNVVFWILLMVDLGRVYGRGVAFTLGLIVLPMLFIPLLGVDGSEYLGPRTIVVAS